MKGPLKWHGGKSYLAKQIVERMPPRCRNPNAPDADDPGWLHCVEPYFGGGAVLFANDPEGISEVANDKYGELMNFWRVLQEPITFCHFQRMAEFMPFSEAAWAEADILSKLPHKDPVRRALSFFVWCRQSMSGRMKDFAPLTRQRTRRGMNEQVSAWLNAVEGLPEVHARLQRVVILNRDALDVIREQDGPRTLFYLDPPYLHETRSGDAPDDYAHEMSADDHAVLLQTLSALRGKFMLSGYHSTMYDYQAALWNWRLHEIDVPNHAAKGDEKRRMTECLWTNF